MKFPSAVDLRSVGFWYKFGIIGFAILSIYLIRETFFIASEYLFLTDPITIKFFRGSKTIVIVPDDINLKHKIRKVYETIVVFCSAKNKSELVQEVEAFCTEGKNIIIINEKCLCESEKCTDKSLDPLPSLAEQFKYAIYITQPCEKLIPIYTGWLLREYDSQKLLTDGKNTLKELLKTVPEFSASFMNFSGQAAIKDMLKYYKLADSNKNGMLHCTAKYLGNGTVPGSFQYWNKPEIQANLGRCFGLDVIGIVWTPRTFGARVRLSKEQLELWGNDANSSFYLENTDDTVKADKKPDFAPVKGRGSSAHVTVGVADGVKAMVTGQDLQEIVRLEALQKDWPTYRCKNPWWLRDYGGGKWVLYSVIDTTVPSLFDGVYGF